MVTAGLFLFLVLGVLSPIHAAETPAASAEPPAPTTAPANPAAADQPAVVPPAATQPPAVTDPRIQESIQRYNAGVGALQRRDLEYALYQFRQAIRLNPGLV